MRLTLIALAVAAAFAQESPLVIRTESRMVQVTIVAQDGAGKPVTDLTKEDFTVTDGGKRQEIAAFERHDGARVQGGAGTLPVGFYSNKLEHRGGAPSSATILLIDMINTPPGYWGRAQPHLAKFLRQADPQLRMAIYVLSRNYLRVVHDFTSDASILAKELTRGNDGLPRGMTAEMQAFMTSIGNAGGMTSALTGQGSGSDIVAAMIAASEAREKALYAPLSGLETAEAFEVIAQRLSGIQGRKNLVWLSAGYERLAGRGTGQVSAAFDRAVRSLTNASVSVYPVDARGFVALTDTIIEGGPTAKTLTMKELADRTGGRLFHGEEIDAAMPQIFDHARSFYTIAFYPTESAQDGKFHPIRVQVRRGGVKVSHRTGYFAAPQGEAGEAQRKADLAAAVWSPVDGTAVGFTAALERDSDAAADVRRLVLAIDGSALVFARRGENLSSRMDLLVVQKDADGKQIESTLDTFEATTTPEKAQALVKGSLTHHKPLNLKPGAAILRVVLRNPAGALGSVSIPLIQYRP